ncbi:MAG: ATP synthase F1 subunit gamma [Bryobacteraceae bacterium]|nr:ATP synthase F1 subunit gamma [Bryobacteraceae bacterium]
MPSLIDIRRRIRSVKNTQQITKAMKMVAAAKLRRAQDRVLAARPYSKMLRDMLGNISAAARNTEIANPLLAEREEKRIAVVVITSDRGLAGAFNSNVIKAALQFIAERRDAEISVEAIGRKARDFFARRGAKLTGEYVGVVEKAKSADASRIAAPIVERYAKGEIDAVYVIANEFKSVISQKLSTVKLLPVAVDASRPAPDYIFEQPAEQLLAGLLPRYIENVLLQAMLESAASEHAARMTAMEAASTNAVEVIDKLTLNMNRIRQASITKEIIEVVSGAEAQ